MDYEGLLKEADTLNVIVKEKHLITKDGLCKGKRIAINRNLKMAEKNCVLAEELGHYHKTVGNILNQTKITNIKQELLARRYAFDKLVGLSGILSAYNLGVRSKYEMAEYLNVTEQFLDEAIQYYREKYGLMIEVNGYLIYFVPRLMIGRKL